MNNFTTQKYWEEYYKNSSVQKANIVSTASAYDKYWDKLIKNNSNNPPKTIIEIGGYPGRYLAYLADKYNLIPTSLDFNSDRTMIEESMAVFNVKEYEIIQADIFKHQTTKKYDIVISNGFIEHFENYQEVLNIHLNYLKDGGTALIMIPNMKYYINFYKLMIDKQNLSIHNLKCMELNTFTDFAKTNNLTIIENNYFGGFPFSVHEKNNFIQKIFFKTHRFIFKFFLNSILINTPSKYFSGTIISIFKK